MLIVSVSIILSGSHGESSFSRQFNTCDTAQIKDYTYITDIIKTSFKSAKSYFYSLLTTQSRSDKKRYVHVNNTQNRDHGYSVEKLKNFESQNSFQFFRVDCWHFHNISYNNKHKNTTYSRSSDRKNGRINPKQEKTTTISTYSEVVGRITIDDWIKLRRQRVIEKISSLCSNPTYAIPIVESNIFV